MADRIVSLIPSATEILGAFLGPGEGIVGVTHECDSPAWVMSLPKVIRPKNPDLISMEPAEVDRRVAEAMARKESLYVIDHEQLKALRPDLIVMQRLCDVCTISAEEVTAAVEALEPRPQLLELSPTTLDDVFASILQVGKAIGRWEMADKLVAELSTRLTSLQMQTTCYPLPKILVLEWTDPLWVAGHWVPEMVAISGAVNSISKAGEASRRITIEEVQAANADVILIACCGYDLEKNGEMGARWIQTPECQKLSAVKHRQVYAVNANALFSRPSQSLVAGVEVIADILKGAEPDPQSWRRVESA